MSVSIVIQSSLGMSAFWEIHVNNFMSFFLGRVLEVDLGPFRKDSGEKLGAFGYQKSGTKAVQKV